MKSALKEIYSVFRNEIDDSVLLRQSPGPGSGKLMLQWLGPAYTRKRLS
jgi:hypothetical protein